MKICIIGGGINGLCCAWVLSKEGHDVHLYEQDKLVSKTSSASSKLLHGGLRYLEQGSLRLVREALKERDEWLQRVPELTKPIRLILPIYKHSRRSRWMIKAGLFIYDNLTKSSILPKSKWLDAEALKKKDPQLNTKGLIGGYEFSDGQMDDYKLGLWVADKVKQSGGKLYENSRIKAIDEKGNVYLEGENRAIEYDQIINVCGPWAVKLLEDSNISSSYQLDAVRGSHLVIDRKCNQAYLFEIPKEKRIFFVLSWKEHTLLGTTEAKQSLDDPIECSEQEQDYLLSAYNYYYSDVITRKDIIKRFAGVRPLLSSTTNANDTTREYVIHRSGKLINVFGGKWTTALALARKVSLEVCP